MIRNGDERIEVRDIVVKNDSVTITLPVFGSQLIGKMFVPSIKILCVLKYDPISPNLCIIKVIVFLDQV